MNNLPEGAKVTEGVTKKEGGWFLVSDRKIEGGFPEVSLSPLMTDKRFRVGQLMLLAGGDTVEEPQATDTFFDSACKRFRTFGRKDSCDMTCRLRFASLGKNY